VMTYPDQPFGNYYWYVIPAAAAGGGTASKSAGQSGIPYETFSKQSDPTAWIDSDPFDIVPNVTTYDPPSFHWAPSAGARTYQLQIAGDSSFSSPLLDVTTSETGYTALTSLPADQVLYYRVQAQDELGNGLAWSAVRSFTQYLRAPTNVTATPTVGSAFETLTWTPVTGAVSYDVHEVSSDGTPQDFPNISSAAAYFVTQFGVGNAQFWVRANFGAVYSPVHGPYAPAVTMTRTIPAPQNPTVVAVGATHVLMQWLPASSGVKNYQVQVSTAPSADYSHIVETANTDLAQFAPTMSASAYQNGGVLYWRVAAEDDEYNVGQYTPWMRLVVSPRLHVADSVGVGGRITITVTGPTGGAVANATVRVTGRHLRTITGRSNRRGVLVVRVGRRRRVAITVTKTGYLAASMTQATY